MFPDALRKMTKQLKGIGGKVLAVGIGHGPEVPKLNRVNIKNEQIVGVDISDEKLRLLKENFPDVKSHRSLEEAGDKFDAVMVSPGVIKGVEDNEIARQIKQYIKKTKKGGRIVIDLAMYHPDYEEMKKFGIVKDTNKGVIKDAGTHADFMADFKSGPGNEESKKKWVGILMKNGCSEDEANKLVEKRATQQAGGLKMMVDRVRSEGLKESEIDEVIRVLFGSKLESERYQRLFTEEELKRMLERIEGVKVKEVIPTRDYRWVVVLET